MSWIPVGTDPQKEYRWTVEYHLKQGRIIVPVDSFYSVFDHDFRVHSCEKIFVELIDLPAYGKCMRIDKETDK